MQFRAFVLMGFASLVAAAAGVGAGGCGDDGGFPDAGGMGSDAGGQVALAWTITDAAGAPLTCDQVGASTVAITLHSLDGAFGAADSFSCGNSPSTSLLVDPGNYSVAFELHGAGLTPVVGAEQARIVVTSGQVTQLKPVAFVVNASGSLVLQLAAPPFASNCQPATAGAAITGDTITLEHAGDGCQPVTFVRARGATQLGTYVVNCSAPAVSTCIETDETLTASDIPSGPYTIHIRGKAGAVECWKNDDSLAVPAQGKTLTRTFNLAFQTGTPGC